MKKLNVIFLGGFPYPEGMAASKRVQHAIDGIRNDPGVRIHVVVLRQSSKGNALAGTHRDVPYETVMGDLFRTRAVLLAPLYFTKAIRVVRRTLAADSTNIIYVYGPPSLDNLPIVRYARRQGCKVVFDICEDDDLSLEVSSGIWQRLKGSYTRRTIRSISSLADGVIVISSHLEKKYAALSRNSIPVHYRPISIDMARYGQGAGSRTGTTNLIYSGSFGEKDGVLILLDAFETLARRHRDLRLTMTGKGSREAMRGILSRLESSPFKHRIEYKGFLDDDSYYAALNDADIPCMTRVDSGYANAGFPFKLGEFLATGKPVVASRVSDVGRILQDRRDAMLVRPGESREIADAVEYLLARPGERAAIGARGREKALELFDYRKQGRALLSFLRGL